MISLKFDAGERMGRKANPQHVAQNMRTARDESGNIIFEREEWLTKNSNTDMFFKTYFKPQKACLRRRISRRGVEQCGPTSSRNCTGCRPGSLHRSPNHV